MSQFDALHLLSTISYASQNNILSKKYTNEQLVGAIIAQVLAQFLLSKDSKPGCSGAACSPWLKHLMQIFSLFMFCGLLVSFLVPETKGVTLEELAGEGSSGLDSHIQELNDSSRTNMTGWWGWLVSNNPFAGGKPAGFTWRSPNMGPRSPGIRGRRERMGIMTSPELIPKANGKGKDSSSEGNTSRKSKHSHSLNVEVNDDQDDVYLAGATGALPGWGTGWGVYRGGLRRDGRAESVILNDVGKLLK